jgi:nucleotide-binding universal stress UspA family protein
MTASNARGPIVVLLDGSELAEQAVPVAAALAGRADAELILVHVHAPTPVDPIHVEGLPVIDEQWRSLRRKHEQAYLDGARARLAAGARATTALLEGRVASAVAAHAAERAAQLLVLTTHGRSGFERAWLGSVADELTRVSPVPLLLIRPPAVPSATRFRRILVPLDGSPLAESVVDHAIRLAKLEPEAEIVLLEVLPSDATPVLVPASLLGPSGASEERARKQEAAARAYLEGIAARVRSAGLRATARIETARAAAATILETAQSEHADLVALSTHGRSGLLRMALGSVADKVVRGSQTPILLYRPLAGTVKAAP